MENVSGWRENESVRYWLEGLGEHTKEHYVQDFLRRYVVFEEVSLGETTKGEETKETKGLSLLGDLFMISPLLFFFACLMIRLKNSF